MKRPWQIWFVFLLCLAIVVPAMLWLSRLALRLDYEQRLARRRAELEEVVGNVLWQADAALTRVIAPETARPHSMYRSVVAIPRVNVDPAILLSPLLSQKSEFVVLHFQIDPQGRWSSPQCPQGEQRELALRMGANPLRLESSNIRLNELQQAVSPAEILAHLPPAAATDSGQTASGAQTALDGQVVLNSFVEDWLSDTEQQPIDSKMPSPKAGKGDYTAQVEQRAQQLRSGENLRLRNEVFQQQARQASDEQNYAYNAIHSDQIPLPVEGPTEIFWHKGRLLAARRSLFQGETYVHGCWFNWDKLHQQIIEDALQDLPGAEVAPFAAERTAATPRLLAVVPVRLIVPEPIVSQQTFSAIHWAVLAAWSLLALAALSTAALLNGVVALSERRAAFVSAVTHELRTPLTTFRLYSEMLAEGMVGEERRRAYLETLQREAERLSHLVENVLQYARLERGVARRPREQMATATLVARIQPALARRAEQAEMTFEINVPSAIQQLPLETDVGAVEQILFNLVDNSCKYAAAAVDRRIHCDVQRAGNQLLLTVRDHGPGIPAREARRLFHPFHKSAEQAAESAPGVGLGLALCRRLAKQIGGRLTWQPLNGGAAFQLSLPLS